MYILKWFRFIIIKILYITFSDMSWIPHVLRHIMCNLHIKETEICQKRSKGIKNWKITYSVILSVLSNKTNLILTGFAGIMRLCECDNLHVTRQTLQLCMMKILCGWKRIKEKAERKKKSLKYKPKITFPIQHLPE